MTSPRVTARRHTRREALLDRAELLARVHGLDGITASALADAAGVVPAALYRTFASLDEVKALLVIRAVDALEGELLACTTRHARKATKKSALATLVALAHVLPRLQREDPARFRMIDHAIGALDPLFDADLRARVEVSTLRALAVVERAFLEALAIGALTPPRATRGVPSADVLTLALLALVHGATHLEKRDRFDVESRSARAVLDVALRAFLLGCGASSTSLDAAMRDETSVPTS